MTFASVDEVAMMSQRPIKKAKSQGLEAGMIEFFFFEVEIKDILRQFWPKMTDIKDQYLNIS